MNKRHTLGTLTSVLLLALTACGGQTASWIRGPTPTGHPTLAPWVPTLTPTNAPYSTAVRGTPSHVGRPLYAATMDGNALAFNPAPGAFHWKRDVSNSVASGPFLEP
jgi:hypothetical protein